MFLLQALMNMNKSTAIVNITLILSLTYNAYLTLAPSHSQGAKTINVTPFGTAAQSILPLKMSDTLH